MAKQMHINRRDNGILVLQFMLRKPGTRQFAWYTLELESPEHLWVLMHEYHDMGETIFLKEYFKWEDVPPQATSSSTKRKASLS